MTVPYVSSNTPLRLVKFWGRKTVFGFVLNRAFLKGMIL